MVKSRQCMIWSILMLTMQMEAINLLQIKISPLRENENILDERLRVILNVYLRNTCKISFII
jgi:hypothetical protein